MKVDVIDIAPQLAQEFLNRLAPYQRPIDTRHVTQLEADMRAGRWLSNGSPIRFDTHGNLCDGQHRLTACVLSGVTLRQCIVVHQLPPEVNGTIDTTAKPRSAMQVARLRNFELPPSTGTLAAVALEHYNFEEWQVKQYCTTLERVQLWERLPDDLKDAVRRMESAAKGKRVAVRGALSAALRCAREDPRATEFFVRAFSNHVEASAPGRLLFNLLNSSSRRATTTVLELAWSTMRTFIAHTRGEPLKVLRPPTDWPKEYRTLSALVTRCERVRDIREAAS